MIPETIAPNLRERGRLKHGTPRFFTGRVLGQWNPPALA